MISRPNQLILFSLGTYFEKLNKPTSPVRVSFSKAAFVRMHKSLGKSERAVYKNLETLEKRRFITYTDHEISITRKGLRLYKKICKDVMPFFEHYEYWQGRGASFQSRLK